MAKIYLKTGKNEKFSLEEIKMMLSEHHACYVLLTCTYPSSEGEMQVEMNYNGDEILASYLVDNAQSLLQDEAEKSHSL